MVGKVDKMSKKTNKKSQKYTKINKIVLSFLILTAVLPILPTFDAFSTSLFAVNFFFNTKDGLGFSGKSSIFEYVVGFPYSEIGLVIPLGSNKENHSENNEKNSNIKTGNAGNVGNNSNIILSMYGGVDILKNSVTFTIKPTFSISSFEVSFPFFLTTKFSESNTPMEVGRFYVAVVPSFKLLENVKLEVGGYYSALYLWYDPSFNVNIPTLRTDDIFRAKIDFKVLYLSDAFSFGMGYSSLVKWLSYRSTLITSETLPYLEAKFKLAF